jgi:hypothetical protein
VKFKGRTIPLSAFFRWIICVGYGALVGFIATTTAKFPLNLTDNASYQNFGILTGAIVGFVICLFAHLLYAWRRLTQTRLNRFVFVLCVTTGALIGLVSSFIVQVFADSFGLIDASVGIILIGCSIPTIIGAVVPAEMLMLTRY